MEPLGYIRDLRADLGINRLERPSTRSADTSDLGNRNHAADVG